MDLMTLITTSPYWLRNECEHLHVFCRAGVDASKNIASSHAGLRSLHHAAEEFWPLKKKKKLFYPDYP